MSSTASKQKIQALMNEIQEIKQNNYDLVDLTSVLTSENKPCNDEIEDLKNKNRVLADLISVLTSEKKACNDEIEDLKNKNRVLADLTSVLTSENKACKDEIEDLKNKNRVLADLTSNLTHEKKKYNNEVQQLKQGLCTKLENAGVYNLLNLSPVSVVKEQHCTEWWCPKHSNFETIVKTFKPNTEEDKLIIRRAKARFAYWNKKGGEDICCKNNRQNKDSNKFSSPSNWPK